MKAKKSINILLVEDSPTDRLMAVEALQNARLRNTLNVVENGEEAMAYLRRQGKYCEAERPDLILLDLNMPKKDGREVLAELKIDPSLKYIPVIILTTSAADEDVLKAYGHHANSYITKPINFPRFAQAVSTMGTYWLEVVTLPPEVEARKRSEIAPPPPGRDSDRVLRVLLVEDNPIDVLILKDALSSSSVGHFEVIDVDRVLKMPDVLSSHSFHVVITDLGLPDGQGLDTLRQVRALAPGLPVIVMTGDHDETVGIRSLHEGAQDYLVKGQLTGAAVARAIRYAIDKRNIEEQLRQSQRMDAIGQLAAGIAHDFNNLLTVIQGNASQITTDQLSPAEVTECGQEILASSERAAALTRQLLTFSRRQRVELKSHDLNQVVGNFARIIGRIIGEEVDLELRLCAESLWVLADLTMLEQILLNLAVNARDAMPSGGKLTLATANKDVGLADMESESEGYSRRFASLKVTDTGHGISPDNLQRIFDPLFTTKDVGQGTGLGLATVYSIVQQHGGRIDVHSELGVGTHFEMVIPLTKKGAPSASPEATVDSTPSQVTETILLVDDEDSLRSLTRRCLERAKYRVLEARSGPDARVVFAEHRDEIDLLFTDMMMPGGVSGRELAAEFSAVNPELIVIYCSGYSADFGRSDFQLEEGFNFLQKPFGLAAFLQLIRSRLDTAESVR